MLPDAADTRGHDHTDEPSQPTRPTIHVALAGLHLDQHATTPATPGRRRSRPNPWPTNALVRAVYPLARVYSLYSIPITVHVYGVSRYAYGFIFDFT